MRNSHFRLSLAVVATLFGTSLLAGCATEQPYAHESLSDQEYRFLYPRQYSDSLNSSDRKEVEQGMQQDEVKRQR